MELAHNNCPCVRMTFVVDDDDDQSVQFDVAIDRFYDHHSRFSQFVIDLSPFFPTIPFVVRLALHPAAFVAFLFVLFGKTTEYNTRER